MDSLKATTTSLAPGRTFDLGSTVTAWTVFPETSSLTAPEGSSPASPSPSTASSSSSEASGSPSGSPWGAAGPSLGWSSSLGSGPRPDCLEGGTGSASAVFTEPPSGTDWSLGDGSESAEATSGLCGPLFFDFLGSSEPSENSRSPWISSRMISESLFLVIFMACRRPPSL